MTTSGSNPNTPVGRRSIDKVIAALEARGCRPRGSDVRGYKALCPAHDDVNPSLKVDYDPERGTTVPYCFAGCTRPMVLDACGLGWPDLFDDWRNAEFKRRRR